MYGTVRSDSLCDTVALRRPLRCFSGAAALQKQAAAPPFSGSACVGAQLLPHAGNCVKAQVLLLAVSLR